MHDIWIIFTGFLGILGTLLLREFHDLMPYIALKIAKVTSRYMLEDNDEIFEIWKGDIENIPGKLTKMLWAINLIRAPVVQWKQEFEVSPLMIAFNLFGRNLKYRTTIKIFSSFSISEEENRIINTLWQSGFYNLNKKDRYKQINVMIQDETSLGALSKYSRLNMMFLIPRLVIGITRGKSGKITYGIEAATHRFINPKTRELYCRIHEDQYSNAIYKLLTGCRCSHHSCDHSHQELV